MNNLARWVSKSWLLAFWVVDRLNLSSRNGLLREEVVLPLLSVRRCLRWSPCGRICFTSSAIALNWSMKIPEEYKFLFFYFNHWINTYMYMFFIQWINTYMHLFRTSKAYRTLIFELVKTGIQTDTLNFQFFFFWWVNFQFWINRQEPKISVEMRMMHPPLEEINQQTCGLLLAPCAEENLKVLGKLWMPYYLSPDALWMLRI